MVLAVLQAITTRSMACLATMWLTNPVQAEISSGFAQLAVGKWALSKQ